MPSRQSQRAGLKCQGMVGSYRGPCKWLETMTLCVPIGATPWIQEQIQGLGVGSYAKRGNLRWFQASAELGTRIQEWSGLGTKGHIGFESQLGGTRIGCRGELLLGVLRRDV